MGMTPAELPMDVSLKKRSPNHSSHNFRGEEGLGNEVEAMEYQAVWDTWEPGPLASQQTSGESETTVSLL